MSFFHRTVFLSVRPVNTSLIGRSLVAMAMILIPTGIFANEHKDDSVKNKVDTTYFSGLSNLLSVYVYGYSRFSKLEFVNSDNKAPVDYSPNANFNLGLGFSYRWMGLSAAFNFKFVNHDDNLYGHSESFNVGAEITTRKTLWTLELQSFQGFYWQNVDDYIKDWNTDDSVPVRPDISSYSFNVNGIYVMNHNRFSFKAAYSNSEWQHKTAGSWLFGGYLSAYGVSGDSSLIPRTLAASYPLFDSILNIGAFTLGGAAGYTRTWVLKDHFFFNATLFLGISFQASEATGISDKVLFQEASVAPKTHFRMALGYNSDKSYFGLSLITDSFLTKHKNSSQLNFNYGLIRLYYGRRFSIASKK